MVCAVGSLRKTGTAEDIEKLNQIMERSRMSIESGDIYAHHEIATVIHYAIFEASKRPLLARLAINYENQISLFTYDSFKQDDMRVRTAHEEHCAICRAVIAGDGDAAEAEARHHVRILRERMTMLHENKSRAMNSSVSQLPSVSGARNGLRPPVRFGGRFLYYLLYGTGSSRSISSSCVHFI